jgi:putative intracellular protease/amidase
MKFSVILFDGFQTLDAFGPIEVFGKLEKFYEIGCYSENGGIVTSSQKTRIETRPFSEIEPGGIILIPGGFGTRPLAENAAYIEKLKALCEQAKYVLTVCTGSGLLAKTGLIRGKRATSNKISFDWAISQDADVLWVRKARWVTDGKYYTSSGVSAGIDMSLGFVADTAGADIAKKVAYAMEYIWNEDRENDPFMEGRMP